MVHNNLRKPFEHIIIIANPMTPPSTAIMNAGNSGTMVYSVLSIFNDAEKMFLEFGFPMTTS
ncbi:hypothetical protein Ngar_c11920 [Candidatus Nitrososphaera gargensis Ga9.2]|uniref:Uncharacterized protein n=1 Tax=Nitrososphaera gargensis (strain Ga9.2) TaxID=1237085 RepID=K0IJ13_NITGG|nr:hypothetical protein Ngar_c11920 [Candidatus Nitrososphaera gargensis Ga9.2]